MLLRTKQASYVFETVNKGRGGVFGHTRAINLYVLNDGRELSGNFVRFEDRYKDGRDIKSESKSMHVLSYLKEHSDQAFYSKDIVQALKVKSCDIMVNVRRFEKKGLVFVRGYQSHDNRSPFLKGYILTYVNQSLPRDAAIKEAFDRTNKIITDNPTSNSIHERIRLIRDQLLTTNQLLSQNYFKQLLNCPIDTLRQALKRAMQLYPDIKEVRPEQEYLLNVDEGRMLSAMERLKKFLFRPATIDELAVETGVTPAVAEKLAYKLAAQAGWFNPSLELIAHAREKLGEVLVCTARIKQNVFSDADLNHIYRDVPDIMDEAKRFLKEQPSMIPTLQPDQNLHPVAWRLSWPDEALKYLGSPHKPKTRPIPGAGVYFIKH